MSVADRHRLGTVKNGFVLDSHAVNIYRCGVGAQMPGSMLIPTEALPSPLLSQRWGMAFRLLLRMDEMPKVDVVIVPSQKAPGGIDGPEVSPLAPAFANAVFAATGIRIRYFLITAYDRWAV